MPDTVKIGKSSRSNGSGVNFSGPGLAEHGYSQPHAAGWRQTVYFAPGRIRIEAEEYTAGKTIVRQITPQKILLNELETGYEVVKPIPVFIREVDGGFVASFKAANVNSSGDTWDEAVANLQSLLGNILDLLLSHRPEKLGPAPKQQLAVLQSFIEKLEDAD